MGEIPKPAPVDTTSPAPVLIPYFEITSTPLPDRSDSIDPKHTYARGGTDSPNSGDEYNPVLEVTSLPEVDLHVVPHAPETQSE